MHSAFVIDVHACLPSRIGSIDGNSSSTCRLISRLEHDAKPGPSAEFVIAIAGSSKPDEWSVPQQSDIELGRALRRRKRRISKKWGSPRYAARVGFVRFSHRLGQQIEASPGGLCRDSRIGVENNRGRNPDSASQCSDSAEDRRHRHSVVAVHGLKAGPHPAFGALYRSFSVCCRCPWGRRQHTSVIAHPQLMGYGERVYPLRRSQGRYLHFRAGMSGQRS